METPAIWIFTHDSIGLGEDGPTHQPVEQLASLRAMPGLVTVRPCDANETVEAWRTIMQLYRSPAALVLTRRPSRSSIASATSPPQASSGAPTCSPTPTTRSRS